MNTPKRFTEGQIVLWQGIADTLSGVVSRDDGPEFSDRVNISAPNGSVRVERRLLRLYDPRSDADAMAIRNHPLAKRKD